MTFRAIDTAKCVTQSDDHHGHRGHRGHRGHNGHHGCQCRHGLHVRGDRQDRHKQIFICEGQLSQFLRCFPNGLLHANARHNVVFISGVVYNEDASVMKEILHAGELDDCKLRQTTSLCPLANICIFVFGGAGLSQYKFYPVSEYSTACSNCPLQLIMNMSH